MLQKVVTGTILGTICAISGYLIADQIPRFEHLWWAGYAGGVAGLAVAWLTLGLERVPLQGLPPWLGVDRALGKVLTREDVARDEDGVYRIKR